MDIRMHSHAVRPSFVSDKAVIRSLYPPAGSYTDPVAFLLTHSSCNEGCLPADGYIGYFHWSTI